MECHNNRHDMRSDSMGNGKCFAASSYSKYKERQNTLVKLTPPDLYYSLYGAVVTVFAYTVVNTGNVNETQEVIGSGFFVASDRIMTAASVVLYNPLPDPLLPVLPRVPPPTPSNATIVRANFYRVRVQNVKNKGESFFYDAQLKYVSPSFDLALLELIPPLDKCTPMPNPHPILEWGCSRDLAIGDEVYVIGDYLNQQTMGIVKGVVVDNVYNDTRLGPDAIGTFNDNYYGFEGLLTSLLISREYIGGPILNSYGRVVGVMSNVDFLAETFFDTIPYPNQYWQSGQWRTVAVAEHVAYQIYSTFLGGPADKCTGGHLELIRDPLGNFYRFVYGYLGINRYETYGPTWMNLIVPQSSLRYRLQQGIIILGVEDNTPLGTNTTVVPNIPGPFPNIWDGVNPVTETNELYLLTSINGNKIGVAEGQVGITTVTRLHIADDGCEIHFRLGSEGFGKSHAVQVQFQDLPQAMDLPPNFLSLTPIARGLNLPQQESTELIERGFGGKQAMSALQALASQAHNILDLVKKTALVKLDENHDGKIQASEVLSAVVGLVHTANEQAAAPEVAPEAPAIDLSHTPAQ